MAEHIEYQGNFSGSQIDTLLAKIQSSQVFTTEEKTKLASLVNYDDTEVKEDISDIETSLNSHKSNKTNPHEVTKAQVGLGNVDNTSDANKPISTATQAALDNKVNTEEGKGLSTNDFTNEDKEQITTNKNGIATLTNAGAKNLLKNEKHSGATITSQGATWVFSEGTMEARISGTVGATWSDVSILNNALDLSDKEYVVVVQSDVQNAFVYLSGNTLSGGNIPTNGQYYPGTYRFKGIIGANARFTARTGTFDSNFLRIMICTVEDYAISPEFVPYAPTNRELYEMILSLQSGS